jgi:hypothetical protein
MNNEHKEILQLIEDTKLQLEKIRSDIDKLFDRLDSILDITTIKTQITEL